MLQKIRETFKPESSYKAFFISILTFALAYGLYKGVIDNYLAEVAGMSEFDKGVSEFFREIPGLLLIFVLAILYELSAERIYQIGALIMLAGILWGTIGMFVKVLDAKGSCGRAKAESHSAAKMRCTRSGLWRDTL